MHTLLTNKRSLFAVRTISEHAVNNDLNLLCLVFAREGIGVVILNVWKKKYLSSLDFICILKSVPICSHAG